MSLPEINTVLQKESGLKGICGMNDLRDIHAAADKGDARARLALDMFVYRCRQYIGAYFFQLGRVDALVFTAGVGENDPAIRESCCRRMTSLGLTVDPLRNRNPEKYTAEKSPPPEARSRAMSSPPTKNSKSPARPPM